MRKAAATFVILSLLTIQSQAVIRVTEVMSSSAQSGTSDGDWFELTNTGLTLVDLSGWSWDDNSNTPGSAGFGGVSIAAGQSIIITQEEPGGSAAWLSDWGISGVTVVALGNGAFQNFSSSGDSVNIYQGTTLISSVTFSTATQGFSFEWDTNGTSLGLSALGENGAFKAAFNGAGGGAEPAGIDIASPGYAVPEPGVIALAGLGALGLLARRRRK